MRDEERESPHINLHSAFCSIYSESRLNNFHLTYFPLVWCGRSVVVENETARVEEEVIERSN